MKKWSTVQEIVESFAVRADPSDRPAVISELKKMRSEIHPDRDGGTFSNSETEFRYHSLNEAISFVENTASNALVAVKDLPLIIATIQQALVAAGAPTRVVQAKDEFRRDALGALHSRLQLPRISSAALAAVCAAIVTFSGALKDNPVFGPLLAIPQTGEVLLVAAACAGVFFVITWFSEQAEAQRIEWLTTDAALRALIYEVSFRGTETEKGGVSFTFGEFVRSLVELSRGQQWFGPMPRGFRSLFPFRQRGLSASSAEKLAKAHLEELEKRQAVSKKEGRLHSQYEVAKEVLEEVRRTFVDDQIT